MHPILSMANWLHDFEASQAAGRTIFKLPYPGGTWAEEKERNEWLLHLMQMAWKTAVMGFKVKEGKTLTKEEDQLLNKIAGYL